MDANIDGVNFNRIEDVGSLAEDGHLIDILPG